MVANFLKTPREKLLGLSLHEYKKLHKTKMIDHKALFLNKDLVLETSSFQNSVPRFTYLYLSLTDINLVASLSGRNTKTTTQCMTLFSCNIIYSITSRTFIYFTYQQNLPSQNETQIVFTHRR